jgi:hypothetical protein
MAAQEPRKVVLTPAHPQGAPPTIDDSGPVRAVTPRSGLIAAGMVLLWTVGACFMVVRPTVYGSYLILTLGFGALLTVFLLQFPRLFLGTVLGVWVAVFVLSMLSASPEDYPRLIGGQWRSAAVIAGLAVLAIYLRRRPLGRGELVLIYACVLITIPWCIGVKACIESSAGNLFEVQRAGEPLLYGWARQLPWWGPTIATGNAPPSPEALEAMAGFANGNGGNVPWALWWRPMLYWVGMCLAFEAMLMGLLLMFRKRWIEHERLPFVWAEPPLLLIRGDPAQPGTMQRWAPFLLGLLVCLPAILLVGPTEQALSSWSIPPWSGNQQGLLGGIDLTSLNLLPGVDLKLFWCPFVLAMFLLFPLDVLVTAGLAFLLLRIVLPGVMNSLGMTTAQGYLNLFIHYGIRLGGAIGLLFWSLWFNRRTLWDYVRSLWGGRARTAEGADEIPRLALLILSAGGAAAFIALGCYATSPIQMVCLTGLILVFCFAQTRMRAEGPLYSNENNFSSHMLTGVQRDFLHDHVTLAGEGVPVTGNSWATHWMQWGFNGQFKSFGPHNMLLEAFKVGHELRVRAVTLAKAIGLTMLVVAVVTVVLYVYLMYCYGIDANRQGGLFPSENLTQWSERSAAYGIYSHSSVFWVPGDSFYKQWENCFNALYGVILVGVLFYLRREFPRFPLSPVGVVLIGENFGGGGSSFSPYTIWFSFLLVGVVKALVFRWLGVRYFRQKLQPIAIMLICGMVYGMVLYIFRHIALGQGGLR